MYAYKYAVIIAVIQWVVINMIAVVNSFYNVQSQMLHTIKIPLTSNIKYLSPTIFITALAYEYS